MPASKGPNVHIIGAISTEGVLQMVKRRGSFRRDEASQWLQQLCSTLVGRGFDVTNVVIVHDNAPCHVGFVEALGGMESRPILLPLGPYSPALNPIENVWSKLKSAVKARNRPQVLNPPRLGLQRLEYLEGVIAEALDTITTTDCVNSIQHAHVFIQRAIALEDMPVGQ